MVNGQHYLKGHRFLSSVLMQGTATPSTHMLATIKTGSHVTSIEQVFCRRPLAKQISVNKSNLRLQGQTQKKKKRQDLTLNKISSHRVAWFCCRILTAGEEQAAMQFKKALYLHSLLDMHASSLKHADLWDRTHKQDLSTKGKTFLI